MWTGVVGSQVLNAFDFLQRKTDVSPALQNATLAYFSLPTSTVMGLDWKQNRNRCAKWSMKRGADKKIGIASIRCIQIVVIFLNAIQTIFCVPSSRWTHNLRNFFEIFTFGECEKLLSPSRAEKLRVLIRTRVPVRSKTWAGTQRCDQSAPPTLDRSPTTRR